MADDLKLWLSLVFQAGNVLMTVVIWLYVRYGDRNKEIDSKFEGLRNEFDTRLDSQDRQITAISEQLKHVPTQENLGEIYERINGVDGLSREIKGRLEGMDNNLRIMVNNVMEKGFGGLTK
jgi:hypothetical protein